MGSSRDRFFFALSLAYVVVLVSCIGALCFIPYLATEPIGHAVPGCHLTGDQLVFGATCHGFLGDDAVAALLSLPLALVLLPLSALGALAEAVEAADVGRFLLGAAGAFVGASLWAPMIHFARTVHRVTGG